MNEITSSSKLVEVDARGRVSLVRFLEPDQRYKHYFVEVEPGGVVVLTPAVAVEAKLVDTKSNKEGT